MRELAENPRKKRRRRSKNVWSGHKRAHARAAHKGWRKKKRSCRRAFAHNPGGAGLTGKLTAGFSPTVIKGVLPMAVGALANTYAAPWVAGKIGWTSGWKYNVVSLATAGGLAAVSGAVRPKLAAPVLVGALAQTIISAYEAWSAGKSMELPAPGPKGKPIPALKGMGETKWTPEFGMEGLADSGDWSPEIGMDGLAESPDAYDFETAGY